MGKLKEMKDNEILVYRCFVRPEKQSGLYYSACIDLNISSGGSTLTEAIDSLNEQIEEFIAYALRSKDFSLLKRPAPLAMKLDYYSVLLSCHLSRIINHWKNRRTFKKDIRLKLQVTH